MKSNKIQGKTSRSECVAETVNYSVIRVDRRFRNLYTNREAERMMGLPAEATLGKTPREIGIPGPLISILESLLGQVFDSGCEVDTEFSYRNQLLHLHMIPEPGPDGTIETVLSVFRDITEQKKREEQAKTQNELFQTIMENIPVMVWIYGKAGDIRFLNQAFERMTGWTTDEWRSMNMMEKLYPDTEYRREIAEYMQHPGPGWKDITMHIKNGSTLESSWTNVRLSDGSSIGIGIDISERKRDERELLEYRRNLEALVEQRSGELKATNVELEKELEELNTTEEKLRLSEERYRNLLETMEEGIWVFDAYGTITFVNQMLAKMLGFKPEELAGKSISDFLREEGWLVERQRMFPLRAGQGVKYDLQYKRKDGSILWAIVTESPLFEKGRRVGSIAMFTDITERKHVEQRLKESEGRFRAVLENSIDAAYRRDLQTDTYDYLAPSIERILGYSVDEFSRNSLENVLGLIHPDDRALVQDALNRIISGERQSVSLEYRFQASGGDYRWIQDDLKVVRDRNGDACYLVGSVRDISLRKQAEAALQASEEQFRRAIENAPIPVIMHAEDGEVLKISRAWTELTGYTLSEMPTLQAWLTRAYGEGADTVRDHMHELFKGELPSLNVEFAILTRDGATRYWSFSASSPGTLRDGRRFIIGMAVDITERQKAEESLKQSETHYHLLFETMLQGVVYQDAGGKIISMNPAAVRILGKTPEEFLGQTSVSVEHDTFREDGTPFPGMEHPAMAALKTGREISNVVMGVYNPRENGYRWISISAVPLFRQGETTPYQVYTIFDDITERKRAEKEIESLAKFPEENPNPVMRISSEGKIIYANKASGMLLEEWKVQAGELIPEQWRSVVQEVLQTGDDRIRDIECCGRIYSVDFTFVHGVDYVNMYASDITERKQGEKALRFARYSIDNTDDEIHWFGPDGRILELNDATAASLGYTRDELASMTIFDIDPNIKPEEWAERWDRLKREKNLTFESIHRRKDGSQYPVEVRVSYLEYDGKEYGFALVRKITERKQAEEALRLARYSLDNITDEIHWVGPDGRILDVNEAAYRILGYTREELLSMHVYDINPEKTPERWPELWEQLKRGKTIIFESRHRRKDGSFHPVEVKATYFEYEGREYGFAVIRDITERKQAEEAVRESGERFRRFFEDDLTGDYLAQLDGTVILCNPAFARIFGFSSVDEPVGRNIGELYSNPDEWRSLAERIGRGERIEYVELLRKRPDGTLFPVLENASGMYDENGTLNQVKGYIFDITIIKQAEAALRESEERYRSLFENMLDGFAYCRMIYDEQNRPVDFIYLEVNQSFERLTGLKDVVGKKVTEVIPDIWESSPELLEIYGRVASTGNPERFEIDFKPLDRWLSISVYCPRKGYFVAVFDNITERKRAEEALRESEEDLNRAQAVAQIGSWRLDVRRNELRWSDESYRIFGIPRGTPMTYEMFLANVHLEDREYVDRKWTAALHGEPYDIEHRIIADGGIKWVRERAELEFDSGGSVLGGFGTVQDITERKHAEEEIERSRAWLERIAIATPDVIFVHDIVQNRNVYTNRSLIEVLGYTPEEFKDLTNILEKTIAPEDQAEVKRFYRDMGQAKPGEVRVLTHRTLHKSGRIIWLEISATPFTWDERGNV